MAREPRCIVPGTAYHLISRFVDREWFIKAEEERRHYRRLLGRALSETDWRCLAFAVMSNHFHLAAIAGEQPLDSWIRRVHAPFATSLNLAYDRIGPIFVRGPKDIPIEEERIGSVIAYIHNNPVRARVVKHAAETDWTSHREYVGLARCPPWLHVNEGLARSGFVPTNATAFDAWVGDPARIEFDHIYEKAVNEKAVSPVRRRVLPIAASEIVAATASELGLSIGQLTSSRRGALESAAREVAVYCASRCGLLGTDIAGALAITQQAVSHILTRAVREDAKLVAERVMSRFASR
jgi:hypothetical protein